MKFKLNYLAIPLITVVVAVLGGKFSTGGMEWYNTELIKPALTPAKWAFPVAWNLIFLLTTISALIIWNGGNIRNKFRTFICGEKKRPEYWIVTNLFVANAILNVLWSYMFFQVHDVKAAFFEMILLELTLVGLVLIGWRISRVASALLLPYLIWVGFATYLTYQIIQLNNIS